MISPTSFSNVKSKWKPEISHHWYGSIHKSVFCRHLPKIVFSSPSAKVILVGTKIDLRSDNATGNYSVRSSYRIPYTPSIVDGLRKRGQAPISEAEGEALGRELGALAYIECSALTQTGLKTVFDAAIRAVLAPGGGGGKRPQPRPARKCTLL